MRQRSSFTAQFAVLFDSSTSDVEGHLFMYDDVIQVALYPRQKYELRDDVADRRQAGSATLCHGPDLDWWENCFRRPATDKRGERLFTVRPALVASRGQLKDCTNYACLYSLRCGRSGGIRASRCHGSGLKQTVLLTENVRRTDRGEALTVDGRWLTLSVAGGRMSKVFANNRLFYS